jgi:PAS domain S-box-containing protein
MEQRDRRTRWIPFLVWIVPLVCPHLQNRAHAASLPLTPEERQWLKAHPVIRVAPDPDYPPFEFFNPRGVHVGLAADVLKRIEKRLHIRFEIVRLASWDACLKQAQERRVDMWSAAAPTPQRQTYMLFTEPYVTLPGRIIAREGHPIGVSLDDLAGKELAVVRGTLWQDHLSNHYPLVHRVLANSTAEALRMVSSERVTAMVGDDATTRYYQDQEGITNLVTVGSADRHMELGLAVRKDWPLLRDILQKAVASISAAEILALRSRWTNAMAPVPPPRLSPLGISLLVLGGIGLVVVVMFLIIHFYSIRRLRAAEGGSRSPYDLHRDLRVNRHKILTYSALSLVATALTVALVTNTLLYMQAFREKRQDLMQTVSSQARLIDAVARFAKEHSAVRFDAGAEAATFQQVRDAHENANQLGETGEFVFGRLEGNRMVFPMRTRYHDLACDRLGLSRDSNSLTIPFADNPLAEPMRRALRGEKGVMVGRDYRGVRVLAAYEPLREMAYGMVGNIDLAEVRDPFFESAAISLLVGLLFAGVGVWIQVRVTAPLIEWIQQQRDFLETVIDSLAHPFYVVDARDYSIKIMNTAARRAGAENALTCHALTHFQDTPCGDTPEHPCPMTQIKQTHQPVILEHVHTDRDGHRRNMEVHGYPILDAKGKVTQMIEYSLDITDRKQAEQQLIEAREAAETANRAKSDFLSNMSHELRTPLNGVLGYVQILLRDASLNADQKQSLAAVQTCGEQLLVLINDILDLAKIERGQLEYHTEATDLARLVRDVHDIVLHRAMEKGLALKWDIDPDVPRGIETDPHKLRQILLNLMGNAVKFTEQGHVRLHVSEARYRHLRFAVEDTGIGIPPDKQEEIFDPFKQAQAGHSAGGTGLGLAICRRLVEGFGGTLGVQSQPNQGSTFWFEIPCREIEEATLAEVAAQDRDIAHDPILAPGQDITVLIADDREANRQILAGLLEHVCFKTDVACDGREALDKLQQRAYPLVLMDIRMPVMNGMEATKRIRADEKLKDTIVIAVSASVFDDFRSRVTHSGFDGFLGKPLQARELYQALRRLTPFAFLETEQTSAPDTHPGERDWDLPPDEAQGLADVLQAALDIGDIGAIMSLINDTLPPSLCRTLQDQAMAFDFDALRLTAERLRTKGEAS